MSEPQRIMYIDVDLNESTTEIDVTFDASAGGRLPYYDGAYVVDPRKVSQTLDTKNKSMRDDVVVNEIYYAETSNVGGGYTAYIGME